MTSFPINRFARAWGELEVICPVNHGRSTNDPIRFTTTTTLPVGVTEGTTYYLWRHETKRFKFSTTPNVASVNDCVQ
jgi:hypothetical protein